MPKGVYNRIVPRILRLPAGNCLDCGKPLISKTAIRCKKCAGNTPERKLLSSITASKNDNRYQFTSEDFIKGGEIIKKLYPNQFSEMGIKSHEVDPDRNFRLQFRGGTDEYWHKKAWKLFGKENCEMCGMSLEDHKEKYGDRFEMHCMLLPKDYTLMEELNWKTVCFKCHCKLDKRRNYNGEVCNSVRNEHCTV